MEERYIVSARKYRPDSFETLVGQDNIAKTLKNSILRNQLAHAYLFCGPRGVGKTSTARIFAKTINCQHPTEDMEPCGQCDSCLSFEEGRSYCIHELDAASNNGVDDIKALIDQVRIPPQVGKYSVYIIDEVHMLSPSAFNAFLKTLEEPPAYAIFILATTEKHKILPTILSRCQTYDFNRITVDNIVRNLRGIAAKESVTIDEESLHIIAQKADGAMRDALTIFDQTVAFCGRDVKYEDVLKNLNVLDYEHSFALTDAFLQGDYQTALRKFDEILSKGFNALHFVAALSSHLRNLIVSKSGALDALLELPDSLKKKYKAQADTCSLQFLYEALNATVQCEAGYRASFNPRLHIEFTLMKLSFLNGKLTVAAPVQSAPVSVPTPAPTQAPVQSAPSPASQASVSPAGTPVPKQVAGSAAAAAPARSAPVAGTAPVQSAPVSKPEEEALRARKPRGSKTSSAFSITSMMSEEDGNPAPSEPVSEVSSAGILPDDVVIKAKWQDLTALYAGDPKLSRVASSLKMAKLEITETADSKTVTCFVKNDAQKTWLETKMLHELEGRFRSLLGDSRIFLRVDLEETEDAAPTIYMPSEKAKDLMSKNDQVRNLVSDFGLDVK